MFWFHCVIVETKWLYCKLKIRMKMKKVLAFVFLIASCSVYAMDRRFKIVFTYGDGKKVTFPISGKALVTSPHLRRLVAWKDEDELEKDKNTFSVFIGLSGIKKDDLKRYVDFLEGRIDLEKLHFRHLISITNLFHFLWGRGEEIDFRKIEREIEEKVRVTPFFFETMSLDRKEKVWIEFVRSLSEEEALKLFPSLARHSREAKSSVKVDLMAEGIFEIYILGLETTFLNPKEFNWDFFYERIKDFPASFEDQSNKKLRELFFALNSKIKEEHYVLFLDGKGPLWELIQEVPADFLNKKISSFRWLKSILQDTFLWRLQSPQLERNLNQNFSFEQRVLVKALYFYKDKPIKKSLFRRKEPTIKEKILKNDELKRIYYSINETIKNWLEKEDLVEWFSKEENIFLIDEYNRNILTSFKEQVVLSGRLLQQYNSEFLHIRKLKGNIAKALGKGSRKGFEEVKELVQEIQDLLFKNIENKFLSFLSDARESFKKGNKKFDSLEKAETIIKKLKKLREDRIADVPELIEKLERLYENAKLIIEKEGLK